MNTGEMTLEKESVKDEGSGSKQTRRKSKFTGLKMSA